MNKPQYASAPKAHQSPYRSPFKAMAFALTAGLIALTLAVGGVSTSQSQSSASLSEVRQAVMESASKPGATVESILVSAIEQKLPLDYVVKVLLESLTFAQQMSTEELMQQIVNVLTAQNIPAPIIAAALLRPMAIDIAPSSVAIALMNAGAEELDAIVAVIAAYADAGYQKETISRITQQLLASYTQARVDEFQAALEEARDSLIQNDNLLSDEWVQVAQITADALLPTSTLIIPQPPQGNTGTCANLASCN